MLLSYARAVMWFAIIDSFFCFLFALGGPLFLFFLLLMPLAILGFFGGRKLSRAFCIAYMVCIVGLIVLRILLMILLPNVLLWIFFSLAVLIEILILAYVIRFYRLLGMFTEEEKDGLKQYVTLGC
jgi:hypothetical protein